MPIKSKNNIDITAKKEILPTSNQIVVGFDQSPSTVKPPEKVSIREVARQAGVSVATVSMVLNDNPRISRATQLRVQKMIELMGYRPNRLAKVCPANTPRLSRLCSRPQACLRRCLFWGNHQRHCGPGGETWAQNAHRTGQAAIYS